MSTGEGDNPPAASQQVNPYAAPTYAGKAGPELEPLADWEVLFERYRGRWWNVNRLALGGVFFGALLLLVAGSRVTGSFRAGGVTHWTTLVMLGFGAAFLSEGIGVWRLQPWGRWIGVGTAIALMGWQFIRGMQILQIRPFFIQADVLAVFCIVYAMQMLYVLLSPPTEKVFTPEYRDALRQMKLAGKPVRVKPRTNYWALLILLLILAALYLVISRL